MRPVDSIPANIPVGAYVKVWYELRAVPHEKMLSMKGKNPNWVEREAEGILGRGKNGDIVLNDGLVETRLGPRWGVECRINDVQVLFHPEKDALKCICRKCKDHPLLAALKEMRSEIGGTGSKSCHCSICGATASSWNWVDKIPSKYWKYRASDPHEYIEKELVSSVFFRKLADRNATVVLTRTKRAFHRASARGYIFESILESKEGGQIYTAYHDTPFPTEAWSKYLEVSDLNEFVSMLVIEGETIFGHEKQRA